MHDFRSYIFAARIASDSEPTCWSYRSLLFKFWTPCVYEPPLGGLETICDIHPGLIGKRVLDFLLVLIELFSLGVTAEALQAKID